MKYAQTFTTLNKAKDAQTMFASSLKKQSEKQLEHLRQLLEREKNLNGQLVCGNIYINIEGREFLIGASGI